MRLPGVAQCGETVKTAPASHQLGAPASRRRVVRIEARKHAGGTPALPITAKKLDPARLENRKSFRRDLNAHLLRTVTNLVIPPGPRRRIGRSTQRSQPRPERGKGGTPVYFCVVSGGRRGSPHIIISHGRRHWRRWDEVYRSRTRAGDQLRRHPGNRGCWEVVRANIPDADGYVGTARDRAQHECDLVYRPISGGQRKFLANKIVTTVGIVADR